MSGVDFDLIEHVLESFEVGLDIDRESEMMTELLLLGHDVLHLLRPSRPPCRSSRARGLDEILELILRVVDVLLERPHEGGFRDDEFLGNVRVEFFDDVGEIFDFSEDVLGLKVDLDFSGVDEGSSSSERGGSDVAKTLVLLPDPKEGLLDGVHSVDVDLTHDPEFASEGLDLVELGSKV